MIKKRLREVCSQLGLSGRKFGVTIGRSESWLRAESEKIGTDVLVNLSTAWPQVNVGWVLTGIGAMFIPNSSVVVAEPYGNKTINKDYELVSELREDNSELRKENNQLRGAMLELMRRNEELLIENTQLKLKINNNI